MVQSPGVVPGPSADRHKHCRDLFGHVIDDKVKLLARGWDRDLAHLLGSVRGELTLCSPFVSSGGVEALLKHLPAAFRQEGHVTLLTDLSVRNIADGATDPSAVLSFTREVQGTTVHHLPSVHAKVYATESGAIVTSGNLTSSGLFRNFEYGVRIEDVTQVTAIRRDLASYAGLGSVLPLVQLERLTTLASRLPMRPRTPRLPPAVLEDIERILVLPRLEGMSKHGTFAKTLEYLLRRSGPSTIQELQIEVQRIHPDLCDDSIDRVIDGRHYGKKWKHAVRTAMQQLKARRTVKLVGRRWDLA